MQLTSEGNRTDPKLLLGALLLVLYGIGMALIIYFNTTVWCLGDSKFSNGCGGWELYYPMWLLFMAPAAGSVYLLALREGVRRTRAVALIIVGVFAVIGWVAIDWRIRELDSAAGLVLDIAVPGIATWLVASLFEMVSPKVALPNQRL